MRCWITGSKVGHGHPFDIAIHFHLELVVMYIIVNWYRAICVQIKWGSALREPMSVHTITRQGGLSSPFLFNLFYQDLFNELSECTGGIIINKQFFNVYRYADDLMLASLTVTVI